MKFRDDVIYSEIYDAIQNYQYQLIGFSENRLFVIETDQSANELEMQFKDMLEYITVDQIITQDVSTMSENDGDSQTLATQQSYTPNDPYFSNQWYLSALNIPEAWEIQSNASNVYVAVIDSGVDLTNLDLLNTDIRRGYDYVNESGVYYDATGHGTAVTGIIAATINNNQGIAGIAADVSIVPLRVIGTDGNGRCECHLRCRLYWV